MCISQHSGGYNPRLREDRRGDQAHGEVMAPPTASGACAIQGLESDGGRVRFGPREGAHSRTQRRLRPTRSRSPRERALGPSCGAGALLQRDPEQQCRTILLGTPEFDGHLSSMLVLGHLGAQRLLSRVFTCSPAGKRTASGRRKSPGWVAKASPQVGTDTFSRPFHRPGSAKRWEHSCPRSPSRSQQRQGSGLLALVWALP